MDNRERSRRWRHGTKIVISSGKYRRAIRRMWREIDCRIVSRQWLSLGTKGGEMNLEEQAELAYEHHIDNYGIDWGSNCELFTAGYRAAMRSLYVEIDPEYVLGGVDYWAVVDGQWTPVWWFSDEYARTQAGDCEAIVEADIPSPAEIF